MGGKAQTLNGHARPSFLFASMCRRILSLPCHCVDTCQNMAAAFCNFADRWIDLILGGVLAGKYLGVVLGCISLECTPVCCVSNLQGLQQEKQYFLMP